jgi:hypothetical protein
MRVHGVRVSGTTLTGVVGDFELWFRVDAETELNASADPFVATALLPSMLAGSDIEVDGAVSGQLLRNLDDLQDVFHCWSPQLQRVAIRAPVTSPPPPVDRVGSFYSGGVDSNHTLVRHKDDITDLIVINGFDFEMDAETFGDVLRRLQPMAAMFDKRLLPIETNFFAFERACGIHRTMSHGSVLAAVALMLGFRRVYIPSSHTYNELGAWGSHPLTDRLWENGRTELLHDGAGSRRTDKLREIAAEPRLLNGLIVCWRRPNENCGECGKCLRTMATFRLLRISSPVVPPLSSPGLLKTIRPESETDVEFLLENLDLARAVDDREVAGALATALRRHAFRKAMIALDDALLRGMLRKGYRRLRPRIPPERVIFAPRARHIS